MSVKTFDPQSAAIASIAQEEPLPLSLLAPENLRERFLQNYKWQPESPEIVLSSASQATALQASLQTPLSQQNSALQIFYKPASVLIPIVMHADGLHLLLTRRSAHLQHHAGQISFPGGRFEASDGSPIETALRETEEEIGLSRQHIEVLGQLPTYYTGTAYAVTAVVALVKTPFELLAQQSEVAEIFEVPLEFVMHPKNHQRRSVVLPDGQGERSFYSIVYQDYFIWGATAGILRNLFHLLRA